MLFATLLCGVVLAARSALAADDATSDYTLELQTVTSGYDGKKCWVHARAGAIPPGAPGNAGATPLVVMTMQSLRVERSDVFSGLWDLRSADLGRTWSKPVEQPGLRRVSPRAGVDVVACDFWPTWHAASGKLLGTGGTFAYSTANDEDHLDEEPGFTSYSVYDPAKQTWADWRRMKMPDDPKFGFSRAGCSQRVDLSNGEILLPVYFRTLKGKKYTATIARCRFDGETLTYIEHGDELTVPIKRGFAEPSLAKVGDRFYLTLRNDERGYVTSGTDGLHFDPPRPWKFDDGADLGSYNTQAHWAQHGEKLYLVYTRKGAKNDHVFRHRAPLFMAEVDREQLVVRRATEQVLIPERGAGLGNFGVTQVSPDETWVIATEWMQPKTAVDHGSDNSVYVAKVKWAKK